MLFNTDASPNVYLTILLVMLLCSRYLQIIEYGQMESKIANYNTKERTFSRFVTYKIVKIAAKEASTAKDQQRKVHPTTTTVK